MAGKEYMSKKEYKKFVSEVSKLNKKYSDKIKLDRKSGVPLSKQGIKVQTVHLYKKDSPSQYKTFTAIANNRNKIEGTFERYLKIDTETQNKIQELNKRLRDIQIPDRTYNFTEFRAGIDQSGDATIIVNRNDTPLNRQQYLYSRLKNQNKSLGNNSYLTVQQQGLEEDLKSQRPETLEQLLKLASPSNGIQSVQQVINSQYADYVNRTLDVDPDMLTDEVVLTKEAQIGSAIDKLQAYTDKGIRNVIQSNALRDRDEYLKFLYYAFGVTVSDRDRRKQKLQFIGLRRGDNTLVTKYAANANLRALIKTLQNLNGTQYLAAVSQQSGIGRWELMDTVKQLLGKVRVYKDVNVNDADQQYDLEVVDGQDVDQEKYKVLDNLFISMNNYFKRYRNYKA